MFQLIKKIKQPSLPFLLLLTLVILGPLLVNYADMPWGYERPKSLFVMLMSILIIGATLLTVPRFSNQSIINWRRINWPLVILIDWLILTTLLARDIQFAILGNQFRFQGLIFHLILLTLWLVLPWVLNSTRSVISLAGALAMSGLVQAAIGISQYLNLLNNTPELITKGLYVNGSFGQSEFYGGQLLASLVALCTLLFLTSRIERMRLRILARGVLGLLVVLIGGVIFLTYSTGTIAALALGVLLFCYPVITRYLGRAPASALYSALFLIGGIYVFSQVRADYRFVIWQEGYKAWWLQPIQGYGLDNQLFAYSGIQDLLVDRAHNLLLDIVLTIGIVGLITLLWYLRSYIVALWHDLWRQPNSEARILAIGTVILTARMLVNTSSALNVVLLLLIAAAWWTSRHRAAGAS